MVLSVLHLGRVEYRAALVLQQRLVGLRKAGTISDVLVMLEHPPVLTLGRNARRDNLLVPEQTLLRRGVEVIETNRGGDVTYHGPGQLVGYPIFDLRGDLKGNLRGDLRGEASSATKRLGPVDFVRRMEEVLIRATADYGVLTTRVAGRTGVWTQADGALEEKKIAAIGIHVSAGITSHGFALNVTTDLKDFDWIVPCGIRDRTVTSLEQESTSADLTLTTAAERVARQFGRVFDAQMLWLKSLEDLIPAGVDG